MWILYERVGVPTILSCFVVGRPGPEYGLPVAVIRNFVQRFVITGVFMFVVGRHMIPNTGCP